VRITQIIEAPPSTKNAENSRDPEMHQTKKGNEWHFGMKAILVIAKKRLRSIHGGNPSCV
jgi:IS5 family transposase